MKMRLRRFAKGTITAWILIMGMAQLCHAQTLTVEKVLDQRKISDLRFSPDGKKLRLLWSRSRRRAQHRSFRNIWMVDVHTGGIHQFTNSRGNERMPRWSPDSKTLAFLSDRDGGNKVYGMPVDGGEARLLFTSKHKVNSYAISPDGNHLAFAANELPSAADEKKAAEKDDARAFNRPEGRARLWVVNLQENVAPKAISNRSFGFSEYVWMNDDRLLVQAIPNPTEWSSSSSLWEASIDGGEWKQWAEPPQPFHRMEMSPDRKHISVTASSNNGSKAFHLYVADVRDRKFHNLTEKSLDRFIGDTYGVDKRRRAGGGGSRSDFAIDSCA